MGNCSSNGVWKENAPPLLNRIGGRDFTVLATGSRESKTAELEQRGDSR